MFLAVAHSAHADENFETSVIANYQVEKTGNTRIVENISIKNKKEFVYTPSYIITLSFGNIDNLRVFNSQGSIPSVLRELKDGNKSIEISFPERVVGVGNVNNFTVSFDTKNIAMQKGSIWEINIPGISDAEDFLSYQTIVSVPQGFGKPSIVKPAVPLTSSPFLFNKNNIGKSGVNILFGHSQYYLLNLSYHITNTKLVPVKTEIALPPPTSYQDVRIKKLNPAPLNVYSDEDGNWLAVYELAPSETKTIQAEIVAQVFSKPIFDLKSAPRTLDPLKYWEADDPQIIKIAQELKTPQAIYDYVVEELSYNYEKVYEKNTRLGAREVLKRRDFAVCLEFTDLFVALSRAAGIRARALEGYAYTENRQLRPLSLANDILHSWPEYFDENTKTWAMVDPTWGNTTSGIDYFNSFDFDHVTFVIKGKSSTYPIPAGGYKINDESRDVKVTLAEKSEFSDKYLFETSTTFPDRALPLLPISGSVSIKNFGNLPIYNKKLTIRSDLSPEALEFNIDEILPYGIKKVNIEFPKTPALTNGDHEITILFNGKSIVKKIRVGLFPDYFWIIAGGVLIFGSFTVAAATYKTWSLYFSRQKKQSNLRREGKKS